MPLDAIFSAANALALAGQLVLLLGPVLPARFGRFPQLAIPLLLALAYVVLVLTSFGEAGGGFATLDEIAPLFASREVLLAGWLHFLAFDLLVGAFIVEDRERTDLPFLLVVPCLALTFLAGPAGFLLYLVLGYALGRRPLVEGSAP